MQIISTISMISINETLIAQLVSFLIFLFIINRIMFQPLRSVMAERKDHIDRMQEDIVKAEAELEEVQKRLKDSEASVKEEAFLTKDELEAAGNAEATEIFDLAQRDIRELNEKAVQETNEKVAEARRSLQKEADALVVQILEKVLERRLA